MKVILLALFLLLFPFGLSLADEGTPCGGGGSDTPVTSPSEPASTPTSEPSGSGGPNSVADQIGLTGGGGTCVECGKPLGDNPWDEQADICSSDCDPDGHLIEEGLEAWGNALSSLEEAAHQVVGALANFPSYQYDASHATVPNLQGQ